MGWIVEFYQDENERKPVKEFIENLSPNLKSKALWEIELLEELGTNLKEPYSKSIKGNEFKGLWELRIKFSSDISRIFYFLPVGNRFILLHGIVKKTDKTPKNELKIAKKRMENYLRRH